MLRFLCKLRETEIIEPLMPSIKACLEHRHSYVRKNAALAVYHIHKHFGPALIPDGAELMERFISSETELGARRNAFLMLFNEAEEIAIEFLRANAESLDGFGDGFALLVLELTRKVCRREPAHKSRFVRFLFQLLASPSAAVSYEAAWTLASLSSAPTAIRAAASTYTSLLCAQSDNNVKLIVLERLAEIKERHIRVLSEVLMDMLRALTSPNVDICKRTLEIAMDLVSSRNIDEVIQVLKREVIRTRECDLEKGSEYRAMLIKSIHTCAVKFPDVASSVVHVLMDFLGADGAMDVILFVRSIIQQYPPLRTGILQKLLMAFHEITSSPVLATALWILGEYVEGTELLNTGFDRILGSIGEWPAVLKMSRGEPDIISASRPDFNTDISLGTKAIVLPDGTYATQAMSCESTSNTNGTAVPTLQRLVSGGDVFLGTVAAGALTKLACKSLKIHGPCATISKKRQASALAVCCSVSELARLQLSSASLCEAPPVVSSASTDSLERLGIFAQLLLDPTTFVLHDAFLLDSKLAFSHYLEHTNPSVPDECTKGRSYFSAAPKIHTCTQADDLISWRQLRPTVASNVDLELCDEGDLKRATGTGTANDTFGLRLSHVYQLAGFADPVYAEACVTVHDYDIVLDILIINRTPSTLTNMTVELATMGDLKLVERPQSLTIGPLDQRSIRANIKVSSTETGHIFGTIVYEKSSTAEKTYINLNNIHLDIMDYIRPATCSDQAFRHMWAEFEWENKVAISTTISSLNDFLEHVVTSTNMCCLTPRSSLGGTSSFLAANLYAKSIFGEDALVNVSVEKKDDADGKLSGYIRIRSKTQGIALSLGDRITAVQRCTST
jgi:coatomer subunit beta